MTVLIDTGILLDYLGGKAPAAESLERHPNSAISVLTWVELMALAPDAKVESTRDFLRRFERLAFNEAIADRAAQFARAHPSTSLSFSIAYATARINSMILLTVDLPKDLHGEASIEVPYTR